MQARLKHHLLYQACPELAQNLLIPPLNLCNILYITNAMIMVIIKIVATYRALTMHEALIWYVSNMIKILHDRQHQIRNGVNLLSSNLSKVTKLGNSRDTWGMRDLKPIFPLPSSCFPSQTTVNKSYWNYSVHMCFLSIDSKFLEIMWCYFPSDFQFLPLFTEQSRVSVIITCWVDHFPVPLFPQSLKPWISITSLSLSLSNYTIVD